MKRLSQSGSSNFCPVLRKNALPISQSHFSNFALHMITTESHRDYNIIMTIMMLMMHVMMHMMLMMLIMIIIIVIIMKMVMTIIYEDDHDHDHDDAHDAHDD